MAHLHRSDLHEVPGQGGLGDGVARRCERLAELGLGSDGLPGAHLDDRRLTRRLAPDNGRPGCDVAGHDVLPERSSSHTSSAFWAWSRFSASSQTAVPGASITSASISWPR